MSKSSKILILIVVILIIILGIMTSHYLKMRSSIVKDASELKRINNSTLKDANDKLEEYENGSFNMFHLEK